MAKVSPLGALAATLVLSGALVACGGPEGSGASASAAADGSSAESSVAPQASTKALSIASLSDVSGTDTVSKANASKTYESIDELAQAMLDGSVDIALVGDTDSSILYGALDGKALVVDAAGHDDDMLVVSVVSLSCFSERPEEVVAYVAEHGSALEGTGVKFYSGSAMQNAVSQRIKQAYAVDPSTVGGEMPPDNFYFLG